MKEQVPQEFGRAELGLTKGGWGVSGLCVCPLLVQHKLHKYPSDGGAAPTEGLVSEHRS